MTTLADAADPITQLLDLLGEYASAVAAAGAADVLRALRVDAELVAIVEAGPMKLRRLADALEHTEPLALPPRDYPALRAWRRLRPRDWRDTCYRDPLWHAAVLERQAQAWDAEARAMASISRHTAHVCRRQADHYMTEAADVLAKEMPNVAA